VERVFRAEREKSAEVRKYVEGVEGKIALDMGLALYRRGRKEGRKEGYTF
jgi:hypothetical protein